MERCVVIHKSEGETPLSALSRFRAERPDLADVPMTYAGRLDPMARGALLILLGETCKERDAYSALDKTYLFEILYGVETDTLDILGLVARGAPQRFDFSHDVAVESFRTRYPVFSSKKVAGKPLFRHALDGTLGDIVIPDTEMAVRECEYLGTRECSREELLLSVRERVARVEDGPVNDFRKGDVLRSWETIGEGQYMIARFRATVQSGTYIRVLAQRAGARHAIPAIAYSIEREGFTLPPLHASTRILCTDTLSV